MEIPIIRNCPRPKHILKHQIDHQYGRYQILMDTVLSYPPYYGKFGFLEKDIDYKGWTR